jgi:MOSC domain-containing protein YiiM
MAGIAGDRHYGFTFPSNARYPMYPRRTEIRNSRQFSIISQEEMKEVAARLNIAEIPPEWLGANLLTSGIPSLTLLPPSSRLTFPGGAVLIVQGENNPCTHVGRVFMEKLPDQIKLESDL